MAVNCSQECSSTSGGTPSGEAIPTCFTTAPSSSTDVCPIDTYGLGTSKGKRMTSCSFYSAQLDNPNAKCTRCVNLRGQNPCFDTGELQAGVDRFCLVTSSSTALPSPDCLCVSNTLDPVLRALKNRFLIGNPNNPTYQGVQNLFQQKLAWYLPCSVPNYLITPALIRPPIQDSKSILCDELRRLTQQLLSEGLITQAQLREFQSRTSCSNLLDPPTPPRDGRLRPLDPSSQNQRSYTEFIIIIAIIVIVVGFIIYFVFRGRSESNTK